MGFQVVVIELLLRKIVLECLKFQNILLFRNQAMVFKRFNKKVFPVVALIIPPE